jgi:hypothetical protein
MTRQQDTEAVQLYQLGLSSRVVGDRLGVSSSAVLNAPRRAGITARQRPGRSEEDRFWDLVSPEPMSGCWLWTGNLDNKGYGRFWERTESPPRAGRRKPGDGFRKTHAYCWSYRYFVGPVPDGLELDHKCRVRCCVNPAHLEPVTHLENMIRGDTVIAKQLARGMCTHGHPYTPENTYTYRGARQCRECGRQSQRRYNARKRDRDRRP